MENKELYIKTIIIGSLFVIAFSFIAYALHGLNLLGENDKVPTSLIVSVLIGTIIFIGTMIFTIITAHRILKEKKII